MTQPDAQPIAAPPPKRHWSRRIAKTLGILLIALVLAGLLGWSALAIYYSGLNGRTPRGALACLFIATALAALIFIRPRRYGLLTCLGLFLAVMAWFFSLTPSNDREWAVDVAAIPSIDIAGDRLTVHNVRNFDYRAPTDFIPHWEQRTYDLAQLRTVDFMLVYWGSPAIAHAMVSFGFDDGQHLAVSIEARREKSESYSAVEGFFRQFELIYIFSDERDVVRLRTNYRHEDVYLYHSTLSPAQAKALLLSYVAKANALTHTPVFYNALTSNCATNVLDNARAGHLPTQMSWRVLLSGYAGEQLYHNHRIETTLPFNELFAKSRVNDKANAADQDPDFSQKIRVGLPTPAQTSD